MTVDLLCGVCLKDRAHPTHDKDLPEHYLHEFQRIERVVTKRKSLWKNKSWWLFWAVAGGGTLLLYVLR